MQYPTEIKLLFDFQETEIQYRLKGTSTLTTE